MEKVVCKTEPLLYYRLNIDDHTRVVAIPYYTVVIAHALALVAAEAGVTLWVQRWIERGNVHLQG